MQLDIESKNIIEFRSQFTINHSKYKSESLQDDIMNQSSHPIWSTDKHPLPNEFDLWIKTHANESGPNIPTKIQRKKSVLSMVSFLEESSSDDDDEEQAPLTPPHKENFPTLPDTERAVYQLSHLKLNNIRRPLQQQVVISNMMYWYLSITEQIEYQPVQEDHQKPPLTHVSSVTEYQQPAHEQQGGQRPASPPSPPLNDVSTKSK
ncbi:hypothetical protein INT48_001289 [Thamnidium elegans]|uniref:Protein Zds1 C-terminal domain-containing protein n=1 Tax=Thamnidium elegans TaxID=101142 RepID=A0A8H7VSZ8_9FUNG|nr:hypothetical protein INT48_001289 [Thamnidium elegans]